MSWNFRVMRHTHTDKVTGETTSYLAIHEVYYRDRSVNDLTVSPNEIGYTAEPVHVSEESIDDLRDTLHRMLEALNKPIIDFVGEQASNPMSPS